MNLARNLICMKLIDFETVVGQCNSGPPESRCAYGSRKGPPLKAIFFYIVLTM